MNKEAIIVGKSYECRKNDFARPIIGEVICKEEQSCTVTVERYYGLDAEKINAEGQVTIKYDEIAGIVSDNCFFS